jgi:Flp pilus assembly protein CpaB
MASDRGTLSRSAGLSGDQAPWAEPTAPAGRRLPSAPRERKPALFALAVLLVALGAGAAGLLVIRAGAKVQAIEIVEQVNQGTQIPVTAMREVGLSAGSDVSYVPWDQAAQVAQYFAGTTIPAGTLLTGQMAVKKSNVAANKDIVGLSLKAGQLPGSLQPGEKVAAFAIGSACGVTGGSTITPSADVIDVSGNANEPGSTASVTVAVEPADAAAMTCAASNGNVGLALLPGNG